MERLICLVMGYGFGLFQTGYLYGKYKHMDIRQHGSGNAGATNTLRVMGPKAGLIVFLGDFFKTVAAMILARTLFGNSSCGGDLLALYAGLGATLGHNFPFYLNFKGGKGVACMAGIVTALDLRIMLVCLAVFAGTVAATRYVSLGSILVAVVFFVLTLFFKNTGRFDVPAELGTEFLLVAAVLSLMILWRHRANIGRLLHGTENKIGSKK